MSSKIKNILLVFIGLALITLSNIGGHFDPPLSISLSPLLMPLIIVWVNNPLYKINFKLTILYNFVLLLLNDVLIRLYAGGEHNYDGDDWIAGFFMITFILSFIPMIYFAFVSIKHINTKNKRHNILLNLLTLTSLASMSVIIYCYFIEKIY